MKAQPDMGRDNIFAAPESDEGGPPCVDNPESFRGKPELRKYGTVFAFDAEEVSQFSDELTLRCALLV